MRRIEEQYQCGIICCGETKENLIQAIDQILAADLSLLGQNAQKMASEYNSAAQEIRLLQIYKGLS